MPSSDNAAPYMDSEGDEAADMRYHDGHGEDRPGKGELGPGGPWGTFIDDITPDEAWALAYAKAEQANKGTR